MSSQAAPPDLKDPPASSLPPPASSKDNEVLVKVENVSKIFCRDFKKSLKYGLQDSVKDLGSWGQNKEQGTKHQARREAETKHKAQSTPAKRPHSTFSILNSQFSQNAAVHFQ